MVRFFPNTEKSQSTLPETNSSPPNHPFLGYENVDGSEIRRSPVDAVDIPLVTEVLYIQTVVGNGISEPSTVC